MWNLKLADPGTLALLIITVLVTASLSNMIAEPVKKVMGGVIDLFLKPFKWVGRKLYRKLAPRLPFTWYIRNYKKHISRSSLTRIENPVGPNLDVPLENAFAPLKLVSSSTEDSIELFAHAASSHRCIVLGGPSTGKTTLMKSLVTNVINQRAHQDLYDQIPVFIALRKLASKQLSVKQAIIDSVEEHHCPGADTFVESALSQGKMLIILDGLDEVGVRACFKSPRS